MKYAPVLAADMNRRKWKVVGIIIQNSHGAVVIKLDMEDKVVRGNRELVSLVQSYNEQFEEGELTFYERDKHEPASHIGRLPVSDVEFIAKFRERLTTGRSNLIAVGETAELDSENVLEHLDRLLVEVKKQNGHQPGLPPVSRG